jgi:formiminoglutamate deiminase
MSLWWAERAWLGGPMNAEAVLLEEKEGRWVVVTPGVTAVPPAATRLKGLSVPGLVNAHSHCFHRALRGRTHAGPGSFWTWRDQMYTLADRLDPDTYRRLATAVFAEMAAAGFTTVGEFHYLHHDRRGIPYADPNEMGTALIEAARTAGIRLTLLDTCYLRGGFDLPLEGPQLRFGDGSADAWAGRVDRLEDMEMVTIGAAIHSVRAVPPAAAAQVAGWADGRPLHAHVSEQRREQDECTDVLGASPLGVLSRVGAVGASFTAVHGTHFTAADSALLGQAGGFCCLCPTTERDLGDGIGPAGTLVGAGVQLCIGSDSHAVVDGFEEARAIEMNARLAAEARGVVDPAILLEAATSGGLRALGWGPGGLVPGAAADLVTVDLNSPRTAGCDPESAATVVFAATAADVRHVLVGGRTVVRDGAHCSVDVRRELRAVIGEIWS